MYRLFLLFFCCYFLPCNASLALSKEAMNKIANKIWKNECGGTVLGLTHWNQKENFPSFGIAHCIWYVEGHEERFEETFPSLLSFFESHGTQLPIWLKNCKGCPWKSREEFYQNIQSKEMLSLRKLLLDTKDLQMLFITLRLEKTFAEILSAISLEEKQRVTLVFHELVNDPQGCYALIDYLNCKGSGLSLKERYKNEGWGLTQVLLKISPSSTDILSSFVEAAKNVLSQRVKNSPPENGEERWLKGWHDRINTYKEAL